MKLLSLNLGLPKNVYHREKLVSTGIFKEPVEGSVRVQRLGLEGDGHADLSAHGGVDKAVYAYPAENYAYWESELGREDFAPGQFGENLTLEGLPEDMVTLGDVLRIGTAVLEVTQPRAPCFKLGLRMKMPEFPKLFLESNRTGYYLRVLEEGEVAAGDSAERIAQVEGAPTIARLNHVYYHVAENLEEARHAMEMPALSEAWRSDLQQKIAQAEK